MKLTGMFSGAIAAAAVALVCGCSSTPSAKTALTASAVSSNVTDTTSLMSAELLGPAPRVGKAHLAVDALSEDDLDVGSTGEGGPSDDGSAGEKTARRSDGSRRGGDFGR